MYSFRGSNDGAQPRGSLISVGGKLHGITLSGGGSTNCRAGCGTIFSLNLSTGVEKVVHRFQGYPSDGSNTLSGLLKVGDVLYGTAGGGAYGLGTVFSLNLQTRTEIIVHTLVAGNIQRSHWCRVIRNRIFMRHSLRLTRCEPVDRLKSTNILVRRQVVERHVEDRALVMRAADHDRHLIKFAGFDGLERRQGQHFRAVFGEVVLGYRPIPPLSPALPLGIASQAGGDIGRAIAASIAPRPGRLSPPG